ncbi:MAG: SIS domain-containing protein [Patescibacteria group bacterium]
MQGSIKESIAVKESLLKDQIALKALGSIADALKDVYRRGGKILIAGNGGSAADAQHFAAEITCQYKAVRKGYPAIALHTDTSALTAWGNDKSFETFFGRQVEALGQKGDALIVISTSGNSADLLYAVEQAKKGGLQVFALLGRDGGKLKAEGLCDEVIIVPSQNTPRIQECHIMLIHIICEALDTFLVALDQKNN